MICTSCTGEGSGLSYPTGRGHGLYARAADSSKEHGCDSMPTQLSLRYYMYLGTVYSGTYIRVPGWVEM